MAQRPPIHPSSRFQRFCLVTLRAFHVIAWLDLVLGLFLLGYAAFAGPTWNLLRGGLLLAGLGGFALVRMKSWRRSVESGA